MTRRPSAVSAAMIQRPQQSPSLPRLDTSVRPTSGADVSPSDGRLRPRQATRTHTKHTTINRYADGCIRGGEGGVNTTIGRNTWEK
eukprot:scaffold8799_cov52-Cyclotella_meneghiniana.AAC.2